MPDQNSKTRRRIWSDPYFYTILGLIGGTYVVLIVAMLLADATYIFTSDMGQPVTIDFSTFPDNSKTYSHSTPLETGDLVDEHFKNYGLSISTSDTGHPAVVIDSDIPSAINSDLGTPHIDFGGPGIGRGGRDDNADQLNAAKNLMPLGNVLVISSDAPPFPDANDGEMIINWESPVHVDALLLSGSGTAVGTVVFIDDSGNEVAQQAINEPASNSQKRVDLNKADISRMVVRLESNVREVEVEYTAASTAQANLVSPSKQTLKQGHVHVVPRGTKRVTPRSAGGKMTFQWEDPIRLDRVQLLNVDRPGGTLTTYDGDGQVISVQTLEDLGENSVQAIEYSRSDPDSNQDQKGELGVARLEVDMTCGGAVAEIDFSWTGRIRAPWERKRPGLARLFHNPVTSALAQPEIQYSIKLSLISCTISAILSLWVAIPIAYLLSRYQFFGRNLLDAILDIPIVLPPMVVGISLLILFQFFPFNFEIGNTSLQKLVVYQIPAVIIAQFSVACAFAVRTMRATFDQIDARREQVALTLGCSRAQAFGMVVLPEAWRGILTAGTLAWARSLGEFGPLLIFAGATRNKTEVLSTTVFLEFSIGDLGAAVAVSLIMVVAAVIVLVVARIWGNRTLTI